MFKKGDFVKAKRELTADDMKKYCIYRDAERIVEKYNHGVHEVKETDEGDIALRDDTVMFGQWWLPAEWFEKVEAK